MSTNDTMSSNVYIDMDNVSNFSYTNNQNVFPQMVSINNFFFLATHIFTEFNGSDLIFNVFFKTTQINCYKDQKLIY